MQSSIFPIAFWEPTSCSSLSRFIIKGLGKKAWLLFSQTDPAWRGQDGTTSFSKLALSQSVELCFLLEQASSVKSPLWTSQCTPPSDTPSPYPTPSRARNGAGSVLCGRWVGASLCRPPDAAPASAWLDRNCCPLYGFLSLVVPVQALKTHVATVSCHLLGSVLPPWLLSSFCTFQSLPPSPGLVLVPSSPFSVS